MSIFAKIGCWPHTLNEWVKKDEVDRGNRAGIPADMAEMMKALERENRELRQANEILRKASACFAMAAAAQGIHLRLTCSAQLHRIPGRPPHPERTCSSGNCHSLCCLALWLKSPPCCVHSQHTANYFMVKAGSLHRANGPGDATGGGSLGPAHSAQSRRSPSAWTMSASRPHLGRSRSLRVFP